jgi:hypothetical protein
MRGNFRPPFVNPTSNIWYKDSGYQDVYENGCDIEVLRIIRNSLNMLLDINSGNEEEHCKSPPSIYVGGYASIPSAPFQMREPISSYLTVRFTLYTP